MELKNNNKLLAGFIMAGMLATSNVYAEHSSEDIAKKLSNPVANMISLPFQFNYDSDIGTTDKGDKYFVNIQPVIPISINDEWNVISRTILPVVTQSDIAVDPTRSSGYTGTQTGIGNITQSFFFSPKAPTENGWIVGVGPIILIPSASDDLLGGDQWGLGPTAVALKQENGWTYGGLASHTWSIAQDDGAPISATYLQPFLNYGESGITYSLNTESTYDWEREEWSVPINAYVTKVTKWGNQIVSYGGGVRYWAESTDTGPEGWGARFILTFVFPK